MKAIRIIVELVVCLLGCAILPAHAVEEVATTYAYSDEKVILPRISKPSAIQAPLRAEEAGSSVSQWLNYDDVVVIRPRIVGNTYTAEPVRTATRARQNNTDAHVIVSDRTELLSPIKSVRESWITPIINRAASLHGVNPLLVSAITHAESRFRTNAVSPVGAIGLMQVMPSTGREMGVDSPRTLFDPWVNVNAGTRYLAKLLRMFGSVELAAAAYNAGPGAVIKYGGVPPYRETKAYVRTVMNTYLGSGGVR